MNALYLGVIAGALQFAGYVVYNLSMRRRGIRPNTASWLIWALGSVASSSSYILMSEGKAEDILPAVCAICCIITFVHVLTRGERKSIDKNEWFIVGIDSVIVIYWILSEVMGMNGKATIVANLLFQGSTLLSFIPMIKEVWQDRGAETKTPWVIWSFAYATELGVLWMQGSRWEEWVYPAVCLPLHAIIAIISNPRR